MSSRPAATSATSRPRTPRTTIAFSVGAAAGSESDDAPTVQSVVKHDDGAAPAVAGPSLGHESGGDERHVAAEGAPQAVRSHGDGHSGGDAGGDGGGSGGDGSGDASPGHDSNPRGGSGGGGD